MNDKHYIFKANGNKMYGVENRIKLEEQLKKIVNRILKKEGNKYNAVIDCGHAGDDFINNKFTVRIKLKSYE
jgi:hypothetical protein